MVAFISSEPWPNALDLAATIAFLTIAFLLPIAGYVFMGLDVRSYLRSLRRGLVLAARSFSGFPAWARYQTPHSVMALGLMLPCTEEDVMRAYRQRVKSLHPDRGGDQRRFLLLQAQFEEALAFVTSQHAMREPSCAGRNAA